MRALCGAIITAGALVCLGLTALSFGTRYQHYSVQTRDEESGEISNKAGRVYLKDMDRPLVFCLVVSTLATLVGLGIAFVGLAYHHFRRHHELLKNHPELTGYHHHLMGTTTMPSPPPPPS